MLLGILVPLANATVGTPTVPPVTVTPNLGQPGTTVSVVPSSAAGVVTFTPGHAVFAMIDTAASDADESQYLCGFIANDRFYDADGNAAFTAGEPIYHHVSGVAPFVVTVGDTRLTAVTVQGTVYAAGSIVGNGELDLARTTTAFIAEVHSGIACPTTAPLGGAQPFQVGDHLYIDTDLNSQVTSGDQRLTYPETEVSLVTDAVISTFTYAPYTFVTAHVFDLQEGLYTAANPSGTVTALTDTRRGELIEPKVLYAATLVVAAGDKDIGTATNPFIGAGVGPTIIGDEMYNDADVDGAYTPGEWIYTVAGATSLVAPGDVRRTFVTVGDAYYMPCSLTVALCTAPAPNGVVAAGDLDVGTPLRHFSTFETYVQVMPGAFYSDPRDWIYLQTVAGPGVVAVLDTRLSDVWISDVYNTALVATVNWPATDRTQAQPYIPAVVNTNDPDVGRVLRAIPTTWRHTTAAVWTDLQGIYDDLDGNGVVSVGDRRLTLVSAADAAYPAAGTGYPFVASPVRNAPGPYYMPGTIVAALDTDLAVALFPFGAGDPNAWCEDILTDNDYSSELLIAQNGGAPGYFVSDVAGWMGPFPLPANPAVAPLLARTAHTAMTVTIPLDLGDRPGRHVIMLTDDTAPGVFGIAAPWNFVGILGATAPQVYPVVAGTKNPMYSVAWSLGAAAPPAVYSWTWGAPALGTFNTIAGPTWFLVNSRQRLDQNWGRVFLHPGVEDQYKPGWSHTLDTLWGTQAGLLGDPIPGTAVTNRQTRGFFQDYLDYAILTSASDSIGDLQFDFTTLLPHNRIRIYVPPEFRWASDLDPAAATALSEAVWTDITNDYQYIAVSTRNAYDPIAPGWRRLTIGESGTFGASGRMTIPVGTWHIRLFHLAAPAVAGIYHFKIYVDGVSIGAGNYPIIVVKSELNPAWIEVTVRTHLGTVLPYVSGSVLAEGSTPEGRAVSAVGYWGPAEFIGNSFVPGQVGALYRLFLMGVAAGSYTLKAEASGYNPTTSDRLEVFAGQSYHQFIVIFDSPDIHITIWSKHGTGAIPWHNLWQPPYGTNDPAAAPTNAGPWRDMFIDLYDASNNLIGFWGSDVTGNKIIPLSNMLLGLHDDAGCIPTANQFNGWLVDNFDVLGNVRMYPSTHWDGHVPWDTADYIAGMPAGEYTVEGFVTGYIMDEADSYQRSFSLHDTAIALQFDLRRSNWLETVLHLPLGIFLSVDTSVDLTAEDANGGERASAAFLATNAMSLDGVLDGFDVSGGTYNGGIVIEGYNALFPNSGYPDSVKDYGLNPTASSHSAGAVTLNGNPYTIKLHMADMGIPYAGVVGTGWYNIVGTPQASTFLCNSPVSLSFDIVNAWLWISLRSVDFQVPAHSRPWTFPGSEIMVQFVNPADLTTVVDALDPTIYGLIQDAGTTVAGFPIVGAPPLSFGVSPFDIDNVNAAGQHEHIGLRYCGMDFAGAGQAAIPWWGDTIWSALYDARSTSLPAGEYQYYAWTHGYVQRSWFSVSVPLRGGADIEADLIQGGQIRVTMNFNHEGVTTAFNGFVRVEVLNSEGQLVGASIYGMAEPNVFTQIGTPGGAYLPYDPTFTNTGGVVSLDHKVTVGPAQGADFGLPSATYPSTRNPLFPVPPTVGNGQRAFLSNQFYVAPVATWAGWAATNPCDANRLVLPAGGSTSFDVYGFYWYAGGLARTWAGGWPTPTWGTQTSRELGSPNFADRGLRGTAEIPGWPGSGGGLYSVKVWAFDALGPDGVYGTADDWRMYSMAWPLSDIMVPWGGAQEVFITMNNMATLRGTVSWIDMYGDMRPLPWAQISASPGPATDSVPAYSSGLGALGLGPTNPSGAYIMWLPAGSHDVSVSTSEAPEAWSASAPTQNAQYTVVVSDGWAGGGDTRLGGSGVPVPEVPAFAVPLALFAALAASVWLLRKRTLNIPVMMK